MNDLAAAEDAIELVIADVVYPGRGLARHEGLVVFLEGVLPGEQVCARITRRHKKYAEAELVEIRAASPRRIEPACGLTAACPGCSYQHMRYETELELKQRQLVDLLARLGGCPGIPVRPPVAAPASSGYRNKITLHVQTRDGARRLGYVGRNNVTVLDVQACPLAHPDINRRLTELRADREALDALPDGASVVLRRTGHDGVLWWPKGNPPRVTLREDTPLGTLEVPPDSFFQVNPDVAAQLVERAGKIVSRCKPRVAIDLFCGVGTFAIAAGLRGVPAVLGIDSDRHAIRSARRNASAHGLRGVEFHAGRVMDCLDGALQPVAPAETLLIVDPPRSGLERPIVDRLAAYGAANLLYVACAPDTMARDVRVLVNSGYRPEETGLFDMFPRTPYFESLTHLRKDVPVSP